MSTAALETQPIDRSAHEILVVDDDPTKRYTTSRWLRAAGFRTRDAKTGSEALALANDEISAVVLDVHLPDIDGFEVCRRLHAASSTRRLPVLHLSAAFVSDEDKVRGLNAGADAYMTHPADPGVLVASVQALVRVREAESALLRKEAELRQATEAALHAEREKGELREQFVAVLGHDLRNPVAAISAIGELLIRRGSERELGLRIRSSTARVSRLINDVLDFTRGRLGSRLGVQMAPAGDLARALRDVVDEARQANAVREIECNIDVESDVWCDQGRIQQLLSNLFGNALQHGAADRPIAVSASTSRDLLTIQVANHGNPISAADMHKIFEPFWRSPESQQGGGLGLGLHICAQIVEAHRGKLSVTSSREAGTRFTAVLPTDQKVE